MIVGLAVTRKRGFAPCCLSMLADWDRVGGSNTLGGKLGGNSNPVRSGAILYHHDHEREFSTSPLAILHGTV